MPNPWNTIMMLASPPVEDHVIDWAGAQEKERVPSLDLFHAVYKRDTKRVSSLIHQGAKVNVRLHHEARPDLDQAVINRPNQGMAPIDVALWTMLNDESGYALEPTEDQPRDHGVMKLLLQAGAYPDVALWSRLEGTEWEFLSDTFTDFEPLERAILDTLVSGGFDPQAIVTSANQNDLRDPPLPYTGSHPSLLWLNRAVQHKHWSAAQAWFDQGGILGTATTDPILGVVWNSLHQDVETKWPNDHDSRSALLTTIRQKMLAAPEEVYRKELIRVLLNNYAYQNTDPTNTAVARACQTWIDGLTYERSLQNVELSPAEREPSCPEIKQIQDYLYNVERGHIRATADSLPVLTPASPRVRL